VSPSGLEGVAPYLEEVILPRRDELVRPYERTEHIIFPVTAVVSWMSTLPSGATIEVATIGNEGVVGAMALRGDRRSPFLVMNQVAGTALRMPIGLFEPALDASTELREVMSRYVYAFIVQLGQSGACNGLHSVTARCARWLLMTQDRVAKPDFGMTHELLAEMLGVARPTVTEALGELQAREAIQSIWGQIRILDRAALEGAACECYSIIAAAYREARLPPQ
jgi:CRP-like cAMP-binding protein